MEYKQHPFKVFTISVNYFEGYFNEKNYGVLRFISFYTFYIVVMMFMKLVSNANI